MAVPKPESSGSSLSKHTLLGVLISFCLIVPCFWHTHIQAGDLGSHTYNAWLAQLIERGEAPGLYLAVQWQNVLFDFLLFYAVKLVGFTLGEKIAVSICVLVFFWGVFSFFRSATHKAPWLLSPLIAMICYCYVFHMGFMNFYLSIGLASFGLSMLWRGTSRGILGALLLSPFVLLAHPLGILWLAGVALYRFAWLRTAGLARLSLPMAVAGGLWMVRRYLKLHPVYQADWADPPFYQWNGFDQFRIFGNAYDYLSWGVVLLGVAFIVVELWQHERDAGFWRERRFLVELYFLSICAAVLLPEDLRPEPGGSWIGGLATRLTLICTIFAVCLLASLQPKMFHLLGFAVCAAVFFFLIHRDTGFLDRLEKNAEAITSQLPYGTRVASTVFSPPDFRTAYEHLVDRACIQHCFLYSNYEPSTLKFRVRVGKEGSRIVASVVDEAEDLQFGNYDVEDGDLPLKQIYQCDPLDLTKLCIRDLQSGEKNGSLGYHP